MDALCSLITVNLFLYRSELSSTTDTAGDRIIVEGASCSEYDSFSCVLLSSFIVMLCAHHCGVVRRESSVSCINHLFLLACYFYESLPVCVG